MSIRRLFYCLLLAAFACGPTGTNPVLDLEEESVDWAEIGADEVALDELRQAMRSAKTMLLVYPDAFKGQYAPICDQVKASSRRLALLHKPASQVTPDDLKTQPMLLMGTPASMPLIAQVLAKTPFQWTTAGFSTSLKHYEGTTDVLMLGMIASPFSQEKFPINIITGNSDEGILAQIKATYQNNWRRLIAGSWGYQVYRGGQRVLMGNFRRDSTALFLNEQTHWDFESTTAELPPTQYFRPILHGTVDSVRIAKFIALAEANFERLGTELGKPITHSFECHLYASAEEKGLFSNNTRQMHNDFGAAATHVVLNDVYEGNFVGEELLLLQRKLLGLPKTRALEVGLANLYAPNWQKYGANYWTSKLYRSGNAIPLAELLNNEWFERESDLVFGCMAASMVQWLQALWGKELFFQKYASWQPTEEEIVALSPKWLHFLQELSAKQNIKAAWSPMRPSYYKGFNFAHEGYQIYNGYGSKLAEQSVNVMRKLYSNALAIVPYTFLEDANKPSFLPFSRWAGSETDESVVHSAYYAKQQGMAVLLKPQIWLGRGSWPGDVAMQHEEDWDSFFGYYNRWMRHYAMLAEIHEIDMLCLGVEFAKATTQKPEPWKQMARSYRSIYSGPLTYAANWGYEIEHTTIWEAFDFIGINCYYPLSTGDAPKYAELKAGFQQSMDKVVPLLAKYKKPVIFTEIGFRSIDKAWLTPHAEPIDDSFNQEAQAQCYQAVCEVLSDAHWCKGIFWWKWPTYLDHARRNKQEYAPIFKPAEKVVKNWFKEQE